MMVGYARVSTLDQNPQMQINALQAAGCEKIFQDKGSGSDPDRLGLKRALNYCNPGDTFVCWKIDRVGRNLSHLLQVVENLDLKDVKFKSITDPIDTASASGKLFLHMLAVFAEFERNMIRERTRAGLAAARARGRRGGRRARVTPQMIQDMQMARMRGDTIEEAAAGSGLSASTFYRIKRRMAFQ
jgi:DNA invertase Pin-like site-specific DNA recombinase